MSIINPGPEVKPIEAPHPIRATAPSYRGVTVDTRYTPASSLLTHVLGSSWTVNYYSQVLDADNDLNGQVIGRNPNLQQYRLIKQMELKVTSPLTYAQDETSKNLALTGSALIYPFLIPNEGDMFLGDVGDGQEAVFKITKSERRSIFKDTCYAVDYEAADFSTEERRGDLNLKTIETFQFVKDFLEYGQNPILLEEDYALYGDLEIFYKDIVSDWFREFSSKEYSCLLVPGQPFATYDPFHAKAVMSLFTTWDSPEIRRSKLLNVNGDDNMLTPTVWDMCLKRNPRVRLQLNEQAGVLSVGYFNNNPMLNGIFYSGVRFCVYPKDPTLSWDLQRKGRLAPLVDSTLYEIESRPGRLKDLLVEARLHGLPYADAPLIHRVAVDDYYIFSEAFYARTLGQSKLELAVQDYLDRKALDNKLLLTFCNAYQTWGALERFYYTPFVLMLIKASIRAI